jgi:hypothetical protein
VRDYVLYLAISFAFAFTAVALGLSNVSLETGEQIMSLVFFTGILYGAFTFYNKSDWSRSFWLLTALLLVSHSALFIAVATQVPHWRPIWNLTMFFEVPLLDFLKRKFVHPKRKHRQPA